MSKGGGVGGDGGAGGLGEDGAEAAEPPPPPPHPNSGAVMPTPNASNTSRRFVFVEAGRDSTLVVTSFALIDLHPSLNFFSPTFLLVWRRIFGR
jgi:hypothetical protein